MTHWAFDTEDDSKGHVHMINFFDGEKHYLFWRDENPNFADDALTFLSQIENAEMWSTNLQYDIVNTFKEEIELLKATFIGSRMITATWDGISFRDTLNHWKLSVAKMGEKIGLKKLDSGKDFNNPKYCQRDTEITWRFVGEMKKRYAEFGAKLKPTIGSTALDLFERNYFQKVRKNVFTTKELEFLKRGYYGGRTEIFYNKPIRGRIFYSDFNSLYPSCMLGHFPVLYQKNLKKIKSRSRKYLTSDLPGMVEATVRAPTNLNIPYLPNRDPKSGRLVFPLGEFRGVWTAFEIRKAVGLGYQICKIHKAMYFDCSRSTIFRNFVEDLYSKRLIAIAEGDQLLADAYKLILNNLYGKFGQGREITKIIPLHSKKQLRKGDLIIGNLILRNEVSKKYPEHTNFIWSAMITAIGRDKIWEALQKIEKAGAMPIYCDTDSVIYEHEENIFPDSKALGELKLEGVFREAYFKLPKQYYLEEKLGKREYKAKGVPKQNAEEFFNKGKTEFRRPYKLKESLRRSQSKNPKKKIVANFWDIVEKVSNQKYDKRIVLKDGTTKPLTIGGEN